MLPPADIVCDIGNYMANTSDHWALDAGCGSGRNSLYLAAQGYNVLGISHDPEEVRTATHLATSLGKAAGRCTFAVADLQTMTIRGDYDVVLNNEVLHLLSRPAAADLLRRLRLQTKVGGLHVISGYLWQSGITDTKNLAHCLRPDELHDIYDNAGWQVLQYDECTLPLQRTGGREIVSSRAKLIARRQAAKAKPIIIDTAA